MNQILDLAEHVLDVINELTSDNSVVEIWLIGSRVNDTALASSDWDLLVFSNRELEVRAERCAGVDILWKDPFGNVLLEGQSDRHTLQFADFGWTETEGCNGVAQYVGRKFNVY